MSDGTRCSTEPARFDVLQNLFCCLDTGKRRAFHKALPLVKRIRMLAGKVEVAHRRAFVAGDGGELSWAVTGVGAFK